MRCNKASLTMTRYIDEPLRLGKIKTNRLFKHLRVCESCREEFEVYDDLILGFAPEIERDCVLPPHFEANVMRAINAASAKSKISAGNVITAVLCALSIIIGIITVTMLAVTPDGVANIAASAEKAFAAVSAAGGAFFEQYRYLLAGVFGAFVFVYSRVATRKETPKERERIE